MAKAWNQEPTHVTRTAGDVGLNNWTKGSNVAKAGTERLMPHVWTGLWTGRWDAPINSKNKHYCEHDMAAGCGILPVQPACDICLLWVASSVIPVVQFGRAQSNCYAAYTMREPELELEKLIW
jgi:hypothetical protein